MSAGRYLLLVTMYYIISVCSQNTDYEEEASHENTTVQNNPKLEQSHTNNTNTLNWDTLSQKDLYLFDEEGNTVLHNAVLMNNAEAIRMILQISKEGIDHRNSEGLTALLISVRKGNYEAVDLILTNGGDPYITNRSGETCLYESVKRNETKILELILMHSTWGINMQNVEGRTALHLAAALGSVAVCEELVDAGASSCLGDRDGLTPLHFAVNSRSKKAAEAILSRSTSSINIHGKAGFTPFILAVENNFTDVARILLDYGADPYLTHLPNGNTALHVASFAGLQSMVQLILNFSSKGVNLYSKGHTDVLNTVCVKLPFPPRRFVQVQNLTALDLAIDRNHSDICGLLMENGADPKVSSKFMNSLQRAVIYGNCVDQILKNSRDILNELNSEGFAPLHCAVLRNNVNSVKKLLEAGANPNIFSVETTRFHKPPFKSGFIHMTALHLAAYLGNDEVTANLLSFKSTLVNPIDNNGHSPIVYSIVRKHDELFKMLFDHGAAVIVGDNYNESLIHTCAYFGFVAGLRLLINENKNSVNFKNLRGLTPLLSATEANRIESVKFLLDHGANPLIPDGKGDYPIAYAVWGNRFELVEMLYQKAPSAVSQKSFFGTNLLHYALFQKEVSKEIFDFLLEKDIDFVATDPMKSTPLVMASQRKNSYYLEAMLKKRPDYLNYREPFKQQTPIVSAGAHGCQSVVSLLVDKGADVFTTDVEENIFLTVRSTYGKRSCLRPEEADVQLMDVLMKLKTKHGDLGIHRLISHRNIYGFSSLMTIAMDGLEKTFSFCWSAYNHSSMEEDERYALLKSAVQGGNIPIINLILPHVSNTSYDNILFDAASKGHQDVFDLLLEKGALLEGTDRFGNNLLHYAAIGGNVGILEAVLQSGNLDVDYSNFEGYTPLMFATRYNNLLAIVYLVQKRADPLISNIYGENCIHISSNFGNLDTLMFFTLTYPSFSDAMLGIILGRNAASRGNRQEERVIIEYFLARSRISKDAMFKFAAFGDNRELIKAVISQNKPRKIKENFPEIMKGCMANYEELYNDFPREGVDIQSYNSHLTLLDVSLLFFGDRETVRILRSNLSIPIFYYRRNMWTTIDLAILNNSDVFNVFMANYNMPINMATNGLGWTLAHKAAWFGNYAALGIIKNLGADFDVKDRMNRTPLHIAARNGNVLEVIFILKHSLKSLNALDIFGYTPLHLALTEIRRKGFYGRLSLAKGDQPFQERFRMIQEQTEGEMLFRATVIVLVSAKAELNVQDKAFGWTPLHWAAIAEDLHVATFLVSRGARVNVLSWRGETAMDVARTWGRTKVYDFLKKHNGVF